MATAATKEVQRELYPVQWEFVHDPRRFVAFVGGRNSGKTYAGSWKALTWLLQPNTLGIVAAPDFPMLEHGAKRQILARLDEVGVEYAQNQQKGILKVPRTGSEILFGTLDNESRVRGPNFHWGWVDEVEYINDMTVWRALKGAIRAGDIPQMFVTSTPKGRRLIWDEWVVGGDPDTHSLHRARTYDNPYIDADMYISGLNYQGRFFQQEIEADFVGSEGLVYNGFTREEHVRTVDVTGWRCVIGVDAGVRNPSVVLPVHHGSDRIHVASEFYQRGVGHEELVERIRLMADETKADAIYVDPSAAALILSLHDAGYPVLRANNRIEDGIRAVTTAMADGFSVDPGCANLINEFESYAYPDGSRGQNRDTPLKAHDHAMDALRYAVMGISEPALVPGIW